MVHIKMIIETKMVLQLIDMQLKLMRKELSFRYTLHFVWELLF